MQTEMVQLIRRFGGDPLSAPSMQEVPLENNAEAFSFAEKLLAGKIDLIIFLTGVGARYLINAVSSRFDREKVLEALRRTTILVRGPKPAFYLKEIGVPPTIQVPEPNTWREILEVLDLGSRGIELKGRAVAVQEYGTENSALIQGLSERGANVMRVPIYRWELPKDIHPLLHGILQIAERKAAVAFFTNAVQIRHCLAAAERSGLVDRFRESLQKDVIVASIGPTTTEALEECGIPVDFEPSHSKMGQLVKETAEHFEELIEKKQMKEFNASVQTSPNKSRAADSAERREKTRQSLFLKACRREKTVRTPVWFMRQAGRYMKEYRDVRSRYSFLEMCKNPDLVTEVTVTAVEKIQADAAIIFSDILVIVEAMGLGLSYESGDGPSIEGELKTAEDVSRLKEVEVETSLGFVLEGIKRTRAALRAEIPLIGFAGAPFTLASYMIEGGGSKAFLKTKQLMHSHPEAWHELMGKISRGLVKFLNAQIDHGADALQVFDSWVGCLSPADYREYVLPHSRSVLQGIRKEIPLIHFGTGTAAFLDLMREAGGDVIGVDFRVELDNAWKTVGYDRAIQGNLDPAVLCSSKEVIRKQVQKIIRQAQGRPGHIFNVGHGILPSTPVENVIACIEYVRELSSHS